LLADGPAAEARVPVGSHVIKINDHLVHDDFQYLQQVLAQAGDAAEFLLEG
jgi:hypothetical protein